VIRSSPKFIPLVHGPCPTPPRNFVKIRSQLFQLSDGQTDRSENITSFFGGGNNTRTMIMLQLSCLTVIASVSLVHAMNAEQRQMAADLCTKPTDLSHRPAACRRLGIYMPFIIMQPESLYSFYHPTEGRRLSRPRWLVTYPDSLAARKQSPSQAVTRPSVD